MSFTYLPARLVQGTSRWYILFYSVNPLTGERIRFRETFELNRIHDTTERLKKACIIIDDINARLPDGYPFEQYYKESVGKMGILEAIELAKEVKCNTDRARTAGSVESICRIFRGFLENKKWTEFKIGQFKKKHALMFLDYAVLVRKVGPRTHNNYIERMRALFSVLKDRELIRKNPFSKLKKKKELAKKRRAFSEEEMEAVFKMVAKSDRWLMLGILLQYHCFIRPTEMRRMRISMIRLDEGVIRLPGDEVTKNRDDGIITIPDVLLPFLKEFGFHRYNQNWLLFGRGVRPHRDKACGHNTMNYRHGILLKKLQKLGILSDIEGLTYYSWKDTGAMRLFKMKVNMLEIMQQLRHKDLNTTQKYCKSLYIVNQEIKALNNKVTDTAYLSLLREQ